MPVVGAVVVLEPGQRLDLRLEAKALESFDLFLQREKIGGCE